MGCPGSTVLSPGLVHTGALSRVGYHSHFRAYQFHPSNVLYQNPLLQLRGGFSTIKPSDIRLSRAVELEKLIRYRLITSGGARPVSCDVTVSRHSCFFAGLTLARAPSLVVRFFLLFSPRPSFSIFFPHTSRLISSLLLHASLS